MITEIEIEEILIDYDIIIDEIQLDIIKIFPELEDLEITPSGEEQNFKSSKYGYNNVKVKAVKSEELNITPNTEEQVKEGLYNKVTVAGDENLSAENIKEGVSIFGVEGSMVGGWDTSQIRICKNMFDRNTEMVEAPYIDTSNVTDMSYMFRYCENMKTVPMYNTSNVTNMSFMFNYCYNLISAIFEDTNKVTTMSYMFQNCTNLQSVSLEQTESLTNTSYMFQYCSKLTSVKIGDTSKVTSMASMFQNCLSLKNAPELNTSNVTNFATMFTRCIELENMPMYDASKFTNIYDAVLCEKLTNFGGLLNLGKAYTKKTSNESNYRLDFKQSNKLTHDSLMNAINNLYDLNLSYDVANGGTLYPQNLRLGSKNLEKLTAEEIAIATNKGWNVT